MRTCTKCLQTKPLNEFYFHSTNGIHDSRCKKCRIEIQGTYQKTDKGKSVSRRSKLKYRYNITVEDYDRMLEDQGGCCALCKHPEPRGKSLEYFSIDHDHSCCPGDRSCGKCIRGLLCIRCNNSVGWYEVHNSQLEDYLAGRR